MDDQERSALTRLGKGFLASIIVFVVGIVVVAAVDAAKHVAGYRVDAYMMSGMAVVGLLVALFIMSIILLGLRDLSRVDGSFMVSYIGMIILILGYSAATLAVAAMFLADEAMLEAVYSIMGAAGIAVVVGYVAAFIFSAVRLWMRYRHQMYIVAALLYTAPIATSLLFQYAPPIFAIIASALMHSALKATARGVETQIAKDEK